MVLTYFLSLSYPLFTENLGWRLKTGQLALQNMDVPHVNLYAFTAPNFPWIDREWLSNVLLYVSLSHMGPGSMLLLRGLVLSGTVGLLYLLLRNRGGVVPAFVLSSWAALTLLNQPMAEPGLLSNLLLVCLLLLLEHPRWRHGRSLILIPVLFFFWANIHSAFLVALFLLLGHSLGALRDAARRKEGRSWSIHMGAAGLAFLFTFWTPYYFHLHAMGLEDLWQLLLSSPLRLQLLSWSFLAIGAIVALGTWLVLAVAGRETRWRLVIPLLLLTPLALLVPHYTDFWVLWACVTLMEHAQQIAARVRHERRGYLEEMGGLSQRLRRLGDRFVGYSTFDRYLMRGQYTALSLTVALAYLSAPPGTSIEIAGWRFSGLDVSDIIPESEVPIHGVEALIAAAFPGARVMAPAAWGGYLVWKGYPDVLVFLDGRDSAFPFDVIDDYDRFADARLGWEEVLDRYQVDYLLWPATDFQSRALVATGRWLVLYSDGFCTLLVCRREPDRTRITRAALAQHTQAAQQKLRAQQRERESSKSALEELEDELQKATPEPEGNFGLFRPNRAGPRGR